MKAIVTGGAGFIGSNLVDALVKLKYKVKMYSYDIDRNKK